MERIKAPTPAQTKELIDDAIRSVASWPSWKSPAGVAAARSLLKKMEDE